VPICIGKNRGVGGEKRIECVSILAKLGQVNFANEMVAAPHPHPHTKSKPIAFAVRIPATFSWLKCQLRLRENKEKILKPTRGVWGKNLAKKLFKFVCVCSVARSFLFPSIYVHFSYRPFSTRRHWPNAKFVCHKEHLINLDAFRCSRSSKWSLGWRCSWSRSWSWRSDPSCKLNEPHPMGTLFLDLPTPHWAWR